MGLGWRLVALWRSWRGIGLDVVGEVVGGAVALALVFLFIKIADALLEEELARFDRLVGNWLAPARSPRVAAFMRLVTAVGSPLVLAILGTVAVVLLSSRGRRRQAWILVASLVGGWGLEDFLKRLFRRPRPPRPWLVGARGYGFPSGHSVVAAAFYGVLAYFVACGLRSRKWRAVVFAAAGVVITLVGISRVVLGVHYASDVVAGFAVGGAWGILCIVADRALRRMW